MASWKEIRADVTGAFETLSVEEDWVWISVEGAGGTSNRRRSIPVIIDFHVHVIDPEIFEFTRDKNVFTGFGTLPPPAFGRGPVFREMTVAEAQIERMDKAGINLSVISCSTVLQGSSGADPKTDLDLCRRANDYVAGWDALQPPILAEAPPKRGRRKS